MFETSRNLRKLPSLLAKFVDKAADSMTALEAPNTRKDETVPCQVTNANTAGTGASNENIVQNHLNIALLNVF